MYKFLIFDADHTLFDFDMAEKNAIKRILDELGYPYSDHLVIEYKKINMSLWKKYETGGITQDKIKTERFRKFFMVLCLKVDYEFYAEKYLEYLSEGTDLLPGADDLIFDLKNRYKLGLLTNGIPKVQHPRLENSVLSNTFDAFVVSGDVLISKPDPRIYEMIAEEAGVNDKSSMLMIGDSLTSDMQGGVNYGIDTCWYNPEQKPNLTDVKPTYEIDSLNQIYKILEEGDPS